MRQSAKKYKRIVLKIGASLLYSDAKALDCGLVSELVAQISALMQEGKEIVVVSSGAIAMGMSALRLESRPKELSYLQAAAAVGQPELMDTYRRFFKQKQLNCAQLLLTWEDFDDRTRYLNAQNTLLRLLQLHSIPIINENDTVSTDEIKFGDNDKLSALVAILVSADLLIILSDVDGLLDSDNAVVPVVEKITPKIQALACPTSKKTCVGGMVTKIEAAKITAGSGIPCVIANGRRKNILSSVIQNPSACGTLFLACKDCLGAKKRWIAFGTKAKGKIMVDEGAKLALLDKKSLLAVGVTGIAGDFAKGDIISVVDAHKNEFARGKVSIASTQLEKVKGSRFDKEIIHRNDIVLL